jgi:hypothetical protein
LFIAAFVCRIVARVWLRVSADSFCACSKPFRVVAVARALTSRLLNIFSLVSTLLKFHTYHRDDEDFDDIDKNSPVSIQPRRREMISNARMTTIARAASRRPLEAAGAEKVEGALYAEDVRSTVLVSGKSKRKFRFADWASGVLKNIPLHSDPGSPPRQPYVLHATRRPLS